MAGRYEEARDLQRQVEQIDAVMLPYRAVGIKAAMNLLGFDGTHPRAPMAPMPCDEATRLEEALRQAGLLDS